MTKEDLIALQKKVTLLRAEGNYKETIENCYELLEKGLLLKDYKSILTAYPNLIASYYCIGDIEAAFNIFTSYEETCDAYGDELDKLNLYNILFLLHDYNKAFDKAKDTLEKSIALGEKLKQYNIVSNGYSNYSHVCIVEEDYIKALEMAILGLEKAKLHEPASPILELRVKLNIAKAYIGLKDYNSSKTLIEEMINDPILDSFIREKAQCYDLQGHWFSEQNLYKEAFQSFTQAKILIESYNDLYLLKLIQEERCRLCELMGEITLGFEVQKEYIALLKDISDRELAVTALKLDIKRTLSNLEKKVNTDPLTGIYNHSYIEAVTNNWLKQNNKNISCIVFDVDEFKSINDQYGHLFGDEILKLLSRVCLKIFGENHLVGRFGGDEFIIISKDCGIESIIEKAEELRQTVRNLKIERDGKPIAITISVGVADSLTCSAIHFNDLFNTADIKMYKSKQNGKDQVCSTIN
jgi:diguanylate cyclase (GGDEF)-like protein